MADLNIVLNLRGNEAGATRATTTLTRELRSLKSAVDSADRTLRAATGSLRAIGGAAGGAVGGVGRLVGGLGQIGLATVGIVAVTRAITGLGRAMVSPTRAASDLAESTNKAAVIFGASSKSVEEFGRTSAAAFGVSNNAAVAAAGGFGNLFRTVNVGEAEAAKMSVAVVKLAGDLASFHNTTVDDALDALRSGLVGETEPLRRFGILLNETAVRQQALAMGAREVNGQLTEAQKVQARYALILGQTGAAQGDFARTSTGLANSIRIIQAHFQDIVATIGQELLPVITPLVAEFAQRLPAMIQQARPHIQAFGEAIRTGAEFAIGGLQSLWQAFQAVLGGIVQVAQTAGQLIYDAMSWLNPWATHSPSLVDQVETGLAAVERLYAGLPAAITPHLRAAGAATGELKEQVEAQERALASAERALVPYERALERLQRTVGDLGDALSNARADLQRFQNAPLAGERAFDDRIFNADQAQARARLAQMDLEEAGPGRGIAARRAFAARRRALEAEIRQAGRAGERARLERQLAIDPQRRALEAVGRSPEMTFAAALAGARAAFNTITQIEPVYQRAREATERTADALQEQRDALQDQRDLLAPLKARLGEIEAAAKAAGKAAAGIGAGMAFPKFTPPKIDAPRFDPDAGAHEQSPAMKALFAFNQKVVEIRDNVTFALDAVKTFLGALQGEWKPAEGISDFHTLVGNIGLALRETGRVAGLVLKGDIPGAIDALVGHMDTQGPVILAKIQAWGDALWGWIEPQLEPMATALATLIRKFADRIGTRENMRRLEDGTAGLTEALLSFLGRTVAGFAKGLATAIGLWKREIDKPDIASELGELGGKIAAAVIRGFFEGLQRSVFSSQAALADWLNSVTGFLPKWQPPGTPGGSRGFGGSADPNNPFTPPTIDAPRPGSPTGGGQRGVGQDPFVPPTRRAPGGGGGLSRNFATGGSFRVGGTGGTDSQLVAFRATPGEIVDVRTPGQARGGDLTITAPLIGTVVVRNDSDLDQLKREIRAIPDRLLDEWRASVGRGQRRPSGLAEATT